MDKGKAVFCAADVIVVSAVETAVDSSTDVVVLASTPGMPLVVDAGGEGSKVEELLSKPGVEPPPAVAELLFPVLSPSLLVFPLFLSGLPRPLPPPR